MSNVELAKGVYWVGAIDWDIPPSSGYTGTSYNAYLIIDEKITLVDGVKHSHRDQLFENIRKIIDPERIDYFIVNHVEPDHSSAMIEIMEAIKPEKVICSDMGRKTIIEHYHREEWPYEVVRSGTEISLGSRTVQFIETRMLHWPDSMFSYLKEDGILFSNDAFGQHLATHERFDDEYDLQKALDGAKHFYATNLTLLSPLIRKLLKSLEEMDLDVKLIAPDHGVIWRSHKEAILDAYGKWSRSECEPEVLVVYDTKWKSTELMAKAIARGVENGGAPVCLMSVKQYHRAAILQKLLTASTLVLGSPTINNSMIPSIGAFLMTLKGLKPRRKIGATFGSYGWGGEAVRHMNDWFDDMKISRINDGLRIKYIPDEAQIEECVRFGEEIATATMALGKEA